MQHKKRKIIIKNSLYTSILVRERINYYNIFLQKVIYFLTKNITF